jgi:hypothetical protein
MRYCSFGVGVGSVEFDVVASPLLNEDVDEPSIDLLKRQSTKDRPGEAVIRVPVVEERILTFFTEIKALGECSPRGYLKFFANN